MIWDLRIEGLICSKNNLIRPESRNQPSAISTHKIYYMTNTAVEQSNSNVHESDESSGTNIRQNRNDLEKNMYYNVETWLEGNLDKARLNRVLGLRETSRNKIDQTSFMERSQDRNLAHNFWDWNTITKKYKSIPTNRAFNTHQHQHIQDIFIVPEHTNQHNTYAHAPNYVHNKMVLSDTRYLLVSSQFECCKHL